MQFICATLPLINFLSPVGRDITASSINCLKRKSTSRCKCKSQMKQMYTKGQDNGNSQLISAQKHGEELFQWN